jgi:hypothetical protein
MIKNVQKIKQVLNVQSLFVKIANLNLMILIY